MIKVTRGDVRLNPDPARVITRLFLPGNGDRIKAVINRVLALSDQQVSKLLHRLRNDYSTRHRNIEAVYKDHFRDVEKHLQENSELSDDQRLLIGAYFTMEYSLESVALFNPSMVLHPDQSGLPSGSARFIMSLRACGEGHISSIEFRTGVVDEDGVATVDPVTKFAGTERPVADKRYNRKRFVRKLLEMGGHSLLIEHVIQQLEEPFTMEQLKAAIDKSRSVQGHIGAFDEMADSMLWLARSNYHLDFPRDTELSERVIFPVTENESRGIEDARFVRFTEVNGDDVYYATHTAYNGWHTLPQFIETSDFAHFKIYTLNGRYVQNKGMALFPRRINGEYRMLSRLDGENTYLLRSDNVHFWNEAEKIQGPVYPWEFVQIGNCGSPIETPEGWLLLTHGVGPMREYWLGAALLDLDDPTRVIGHMDEPILMPTASERDGYVPNVVYSCGAMAHHDHLVIPYAVADTATCIATVSINDLLDRLRRT